MMSEEQELPEIKQPTEGQDSEVRPIWSNTELSDSSQPPKKKEGSIPKGMGILLLLHLLPILMPILYFGLGLVQLVYVIPALIIFRKQPYTMGGILIGAGITFLLNAACFGLVMTNLK